MADYYSPYQEAAAGFDRLGQILPQIALGMAQRRYQQDLMRQQMEMKTRQLTSQLMVDRERVNLMRQQARHEQGQADALSREAEARSSLGNAMQVLPLYHPSVGPSRSNIGDILSGIAQLKGSDTTGLPEKAAQVMQFNNPRATQFLAFGQKPIMEVSPGATAVNVLEEGAPPLFQSPRVLGQGQSLVPGAGGEAMATGLPPRQPGSNIGQMIGALVNAVKLGRDPITGDPIDPDDPNYKAGISALNAAMQQAGQQFGVTNLDGGQKVVKPKRFDTEEAARKAGAIGVEIELFDPKSKTYRRARID